MLIAIYSLQSINENWTGDLKLLEPFFNHSSQDAFASPCQPNKT
jgi:hypothetical protein